MRWRDNPNSLDFVRDAPDEIARRSHQSLEDLRVVSRMEDDQPHAVQDSTLNPIDRFVTDLFVRLVPPPDKHVGFHQHVLGESVIWLIQRCRADVEVARGAEPLGDGAMDPVRIDRSVAFILTFVPVFIPDGDAYLIHPIAPNTLWRIGSLTTPPPRLPDPVQPNGRSPRSVAPDRALPLPRATLACRRARSRQTA